MDALTLFMSTETLKDYGLWFVRDEAPFSREAKAIKKAVASASHRNNSKTAAGSKSRGGKKK